MYWQRHVSVKISSQSDFNFVRQTVSCLVRFWQIRFIEAFVMRIKRREQEEIIVLTCWVRGPLLTLKPGRKFVRDPDGTSFLWRHFPSKCTWLEYLVLAKGVFAKANACLLTSSSAWSRDDIRWSRRSFKTVFKHCIVLMVVLVRSIWVPFSGFRYIKG